MAGYCLSVPSGILQLLQGYLTQILPYQLGWPKLSAVEL